MTALLLTALLALAAAQEEPDYGEAPVPAERVARFVSEPEEAAIGQPVDWVLSVWHEPRDHVRLDEDALGLDDTWVVARGPTRTTERDGPLQSKTTIRWTVFSLEAGERALPQVSARLASGGEVTVANPGLVTVRGELAEGEDAPRPLAGFHEIEERAGGIPLEVLALALGGAGVLVILAVVMRRRRAERAEHEATPRERLHALGEPTDDAAAAREMAYELSALLRAAVDGQVGEDRAGLTDDEWLAEVRGALPDDARDVLERVLSDGAKVKYAGHVPTRFALSESVERAGALLDALERPKPEAAA